MKIEVEITSEEMVKPSSQTPDHLRRYTLSYLDQISPKVYTPLILFYDLSSESEISEISSRIKKSLSDALALYYPLAGRVRDDRFVECNDDGIPFSEARVLSPRTLSEVMENPDLTELSKLLPLEPSRVKEFVAGIRVSTFSSASGMAIGICVSHQLGDALSCVTFIKSLAALSRGGCIVEKPQFVSAELFPPRDDPGYDPNARITTAFTPKRFFFAPPAIEAVRAKYGSVSRVEALSAFILSRILVAAEGGGRVISVVMVVSPVNIRGKLDPPLPENSFGNLYRPSFTFLRRCSDDDDEFEIAKRMREGTRNVDRGYVERMRERGEDESVKVLVEEKRRAAMEGGEFVGYNLASLCRFPLYDADFGWGDPLWVANAPLPFDNNVILSDSKRRRGIEAYINLKPEIMAKLEADTQFLQYASAIRPRM